VSEHSLPVGSSLIDFLWCCKIWRTEENLKSDDKIIDFYAVNAMTLCSGDDSLGISSVSVEGLYFYFE
jgi:hypothetical protein